MMGKGLGRSYYMRLRENYAPDRIKVAIIAESPPATGKYFYDDKGKVTEHLFMALMQHIGFTRELLPPTKADGLRRFKEKGWILVDATYEPINKLTKDWQKAEVIKRDYRLLCGDLESLGSPPSILIKKNVCQILQPMLTDEGFDVLNRDRVVYFPSNGRQPDFHRQFSEILNENRELLCR